MRRLWMMALLLVSMSGLVGCGGLGKYLETKDTPRDTSLVVGYLDVDKTPTKLAWITYKQILPKTDKAFFDFRLDKGVFYREGLATGSYQLKSFGGGSTDFLDSLNGVHHVISFPTQGLGIRVEEPGKIYFVGSYKVHYKGDMFSDSFSISQTDSPSEVEVLRMMLPDAKGTAWESIIQDRISKLDSSKAQ